MTTLTQFTGKLLGIVFLISIQTANAGREWPEINLLTTHQTLFPQAIDIHISYDPVYHSKKNYSAYPLLEILKLLPMPSELSNEKALLIFTAADGYKVAMPYTNALMEQGYIAFKDNDAPGNEQWIRFKSANKTITPALYYLVWGKRGLDKWQYPWPFQLATISLQPATAYYGAAAPISRDKNVNNGFILFSKYCIRCHSVNLSGGSAGPELNVPKNISEYFNEDALAKFIRNASSYRAGTKMPVFENLLDCNETQDIIRYLRQKKFEKNFHVAPND